MDARSFLGLQSSHNPYRCHLPVTPRVTTAGGFLFGEWPLEAAAELKAMPVHLPRPEPCPPRVQRLAVEATIAERLDLRLAKGREFDIRVHTVERGFGHGLAYMWSVDRTLLATASQSCIVRSWEGEPTR